ncbi:MAG: hypothetical protein ACPGSN_11525, partial [Psychrobium sp.]
MKLLENLYANLVNLSVFIWKQAAIYEIPPQVNVDLSPPAGQAESVHMSPASIFSTIGPSI